MKTSEPTTTAAGETTSATSTGTTASTTSGNALSPSALVTALSNRIEDRGLDSDGFDVSVGGSTVVVTYQTTVKTRRSDTKAIVSAYSDLVAAKGVVRDLRGRARRQSGGEKWFAWRDRNEWARAYSEGDLSRRAYQLKVRGTLQRWSWRR